MVTHFVLEIICLLIKLNLIVANDNTEADVKIEVLSSVDNCVRKAADNDFLTIHFTSKWKDGLKIATTYERGVPIEIQLGTKMLSPGLDKGLQGMCVGEKRKIQMPANLGWLESSEEFGEEKKDVVYEVELINISDQTTINTFKYLDLNGDNKISKEEAEALVKMFMKALTTEIPGVDVNYLVDFFMSIHDRDNDSFISESEFMNSIDSLSNINKDEL